MSMALQLQLPPILAATVNGDVAQVVQLGQATPSLLAVAVEAGPTSTEINGVDVVGCTALHLASLHGRLRVVKELLSLDVPPDQRNATDGCTALHYAAIGNDLGVLDALLAAGINPDAAADNGWTPVIDAALYGSMQCLSCLLEVAHYSKPLLNEALLFSVIGGHAACLGLLLRVGANPKAKDANGRSALVIATEKGFMECMGLLSKAVLVCSCSWDF